MNTVEEARKDPLRLEVLRNALTAIPNEMSVALARAAYSTNIKTRLDFSCALFDRSGRVIAQAMNQPIHLGSLAHFVPNILEYYGVERLRPGDGILCNDGHLGGLHLNDVCLLAPLYVGDKLVAHVAAMAHHVDIGGGTPGSMGLHQEIFQEGLIIPPTRFMQGGYVDENVLRLVLHNVRSPREAGGDYRAQVAGVSLGLRRLGAFVEQHGLGTFLGAIDQIFDYTERRVVQELERLPQGSLTAVDYLDDDGVSERPIRIAVRVTIKARMVTFDFSGSDSQRPSSINTTYAMTFSASSYALRALLSSDLPVNDGFYRVVDVVAPSGTVVNASRPAAIGVGIETGHRVCETVLRAFGKAIPERLAADSKGTSCNIGFGGTDPRSGEYFVFYETQAGGYGARATKDGIDAIQPHVQNSENSPVEETEANYPMRIVRYELIQDSEGPGRWRGGLGLRRDYRPDTDVIFSLYAERRRFPPQGLAGGGPARRLKCVRNPDDKPRPMTAKFSTKLKAGEVLSVQTAGGGGYGPPWERHPDHVREDVMAGKVSVERARSVYMVVIDNTGAIDFDATTVARRSAAQSAHQG